MEELQFQVLVDPKHGSNVGEDVVAFGDFDKGPYVYGGPGALASFYSELILGRPFPLKFLVREVSVSTIFAIALFLRRDLAIHPRTPSLITSATLVDQYREAGYAHVASDIGQFFSMLENYLPPGTSKSELQKKLPTALEWVSLLVTEEALPALPPRVPVPSLLDVGTTGFVLAETPHKDLGRGWIELFRQGFLRGALFHQGKGRLFVLAARKSPFLSFDLRKGANILNEAESAMGEPSGWQGEDLWLHGPKKGTFLPMASIIEVLVRL
jgi:hypothetical protein